MRYRRADLTWVPLLGLSAGLSLSEVLTTGAGWLPLLMIVPAYLAGRRMASLGLALWVFTLVAFTGLALAFWRLADPLSGWLSMAMVEFVASVLPWWVGRYRHLRAEQREREYGIVAEQARLRERARIAQDMHDSLGHELALIALHGGALELAAGLTDEQRRIVGELRAGAVRATDRLHEVVRVLGSADAAADLQPADEGIACLVRRAGAAGLRVRLRTGGPLPGWSPMTGQAAYRVVQEALTNAARHAPGAPVTVTVAGRDAGTRIEVVNEAPAEPGGGTGTGQGLIGLDERVRLAGGRLDAGPRPDGGWAVTAVLPDSTSAASGRSGAEPAVRRPESGGASAASGRSGAWPPPGDDGQPGFELKLGKRLTRRRQLQTAALPVAIGLALVGALVLVQLLTVLRTGLPDDRYAQLRPGQPQAEVEPLLPPREFSETPRVIAEPPRPPGASCVYYHAGTGLLGPDLYRLCFADGVLVAKDKLERA